MVTEEDLIRTVATAYTHGWRQVKLYFMCGLPTETDEDVLQIARLAHEVIKAGRAVYRAAGHPVHGVDRRVSCPSRTPRSSGPPAGDAPRRPMRRLAKLRDAIRPIRSVGKAIGLPLPRRQARHLIEGLLARGDRRVGAVIRRVWESGGRFDGWSEHFSYRSAGWTRRAAGAARMSRVDLGLVHHPRARLAEVLPWDHLDSGLDKDWFWEDWQDALAEVRAGRLPLDALLRLRRLPADGHRDPGRPDRAQAAPARRLSASGPPAAAVQPDGSHA